MPRNNTVRYFGEIRQLENGSFKIANLKRLVPVNQYKRTWEPASSRTLARALNRGKIVIK